jgi:branched-chain amino acid transport system substrate-binding protein
MLNNKKGDTMKRWLSVIAAFFLLVSFSGACFAQQTIKIGGIFDLTGGTGDVGGPYAVAARDYINYVNKNGGVNGKKIELIDTDYAYKIPQAIAAYKDMQSKGVIAILGWGTGDTEAMANMITTDKIPYLSASYSEHLVFEKTPYNFICATSYSDQTRLALKWIKDTWKDKGRAPRVALIYNDSGFGRSPIEDAEAFAGKIGVEIADKEIVGLQDLDATTQLLNMQKKNIDFAINQHTTMATSTILKDARKLGLKTRFIGLNWTFSEKLVQMAGEAAEGFMAPMPFAFWTETKIKGVQFMRKVRKEMAGKEDDQPVNYTQGFIGAYLLVEALKKAGNNLTGENIKKVLETNKFDMLGLCADIAYKPELRKPNVSAKMYIIRKGKIEPLTGYLKY